MAHGERSPRRSLDSCVALTCDKSRLSRPIEAGQPGRQSGGRTSLSCLCVLCRARSLLHRPSWRQATPGTAIWLRGAWHRFTSSTRAMHRSVWLHMRPISEVRLYKTEQRGKSRKPGRSGETSAVFNFIQIHSRDERRLLSIRALSQGDRTAFQLLLFGPASKKGRFGWRRANRREGGVLCSLSNRLARLRRKCCVQYAEVVCV